jgi:transposase, IS5 family
MRQAGLFGLSDHLKRLSADGDPLEELDRVVDFERFRPTLTAVLAYADGSKGGRPPYDPVAMLKVLILAAQNNVWPAPSARGFLRCSDQSAPTYSVS